MCISKPQIKEIFLTWREVVLALLLPILKAIKQEAL
jgi:hypothetical protein